jgi:hypothetical protein
LYGKAFASQGEKSNDFDFLTMKGHHDAICEHWSEPLSHLIVASRSQTGTFWKRNPFDMSDSGNPQTVLRIFH